MDIQLKKARKSYYYYCVIWFLRHIKNKIPTVVPMFFRDDLFNGNNIHIARCRHHTGNKYGGQKEK